MRASAYLQLNENKFALEDATKCIFHKPYFAPACERCNVINAVTDITLNQMIRKYKIIQYTVYPTYMPTAGVSSAVYIVDVEWVNVKSYV